MKRLLSCLLAGILLLSVTACKSFQIESESEGASSVPSSTIRYPLTTSGESEESTTESTTTTTTTTATTTTTTTTTQKPTTTTTATTTQKPATTTTTTATTVHPSSYTVPDSLRYGYSTLSSEEKKIYIAVRDGIAGLQTTIQASATLSDPNRALAAYVAVLGDYPEYYFVDNTAGAQVRVMGSDITFSVSYLYSASQIAQMNAEIEAKAAAVLGKIGANTSTFDKLRILHDSIILSCQFNESAANAANLYGALVGGQALCEGYSEAFQYLCQRAGILCLIVTGETTVRHMWNMVRADNEYYHMDLTYDDPVFPTPDPAYIRYSNFNVTTSEVKLSHVIYRAYDGTDSRNFNYYPIPEATGTRYNYFAYNNWLFSSYDKVEAALISQIQAAAAAGIKNVQIRFTGQAAYDAAYAQLITGGRIYSVLSAAQAANIRTDTYSMAEDKKLFILQLGVVYK